MRAGYSDEVPTVTPRPTEAEIRRATSRFVRVVSAALESGNPGALAGRTEIAGFRGGLQGERGMRVLVENGRMAMAVMTEAVDAVASGAVEEELAIECLNAVIDASLAALATGFVQAAVDVDDGGGLEAGPIPAGVDVEALDPQA